MQTTQVLTSVKLARLGKSDILNSDFEAVIFSKCSKHSFFPDTIWGLKMTISLPTIADLADKKEQIYADLTVNYNLQLTFYLLTLLVLSKRRYNSYLSVIL